jgi:glycosyltransferase involved in cell wall biosynthesis
LTGLGKTMLGDRVRFLVRYPRQKIPELYRAADVFVLTSLFEMMPIALLEAQGSGLPSIVHEHANLRWATGPGALTADLAVPGNLATRLKELLADPSRREQVGAAARRHCCETFSEPIVVSQITDYYRRITRAD